VRDDVCRRELHEEAVVPVGFEIAECWPTDNLRICAIACLDPHLHDRVWVVVDVDRVVLLLDLQLDQRASVREAVGRAERVRGVKREVLARIRRNSLRRSNRERKTSYCKGKYQDSTQDLPLPLCRTSSRGPYGAMLPAK
jgi:hypothetical protein